MKQILNALSLFKLYLKMPFTLLTFIISSIDFFIFSIFWRVHHFRSWPYHFPLYHLFSQFTIINLLHLIDQMDQKECYLYF